MISHFKIVHLETKKLALVAVKQLNYRNVDTLYHKIDQYLWCHFEGDKFVPIVIDTE